MGGCLSCLRNFVQASRDPYDGRAATDAASTDRLLNDAGRSPNSMHYQTIQGAHAEEDLEHEIHKDLDDLILNSTKSLSTEIMLPSAVKDLWKNSLYRSRFYTRQTWYDQAWDRNGVMSNYQVIMSILIKIGFRRWKDFRVIFIDQESRRDDNLPFSQEELKKPNFLGALWREFYVTQWVFCPLKIVESAVALRLDGAEEERRFPFIEGEKEIGSGAAGTVYKQVVAPGHIKYRSQGRESSNELKKAIACKRVQQKQMEDVEFDNLHILRAFLSEHSRIMVNIATIIRNEQNVGRVHYIFYDLAAYSLKTFLKQADGNDAKERHENDRRRRSETAPAERNDSHDYNEADLIKESYLLADALDFLHERLYKEAEYTLAHNDLKPENILVFYPDAQKLEEKFPVGQWKIADFGLAKIKAQSKRLKRKENDRHQHLTGMTIDMTHRRVKSASNASFRSEDSKTKSKRDPGRYSSPEIEGMGEAQPDARKGDIWAFGCVLAEVLAFAVHPPLVDELREQCELPERQDQRFYDMSTKNIKATVRDWLQNLDSKRSSNMFGEKWVEGCASLVCTKALLRDPKERVGAGEIRKSLQEIHEGMVKQRQQRLHDDLPPNSPLSDRSEPLQSPTPLEHGPFWTLSPPPRN